MIFSWIHVQNTRVYTRRGGTCPLEKTMLYCNLSINLCYIHLTRVYFRTRIRIPTLDIILSAVIFVPPVYTLCILRCNDIRFPPPPFRQKFTAIFLLIRFITVPIGYYNISARLVNVYLYAREKMIRTTNTIYRVPIYEIWGHNKI